MKERIYWVNAKQLPDDEMTVMLCHPLLDEPVWLGYHLDGKWFTCTGIEIPDDCVTHWAEMMEGPKS